LLGKKRGKSLNQRLNPKRDCSLISKQAREYIMVRAPLGYSLKHPDWVTGVRAEGAEMGLVCEIYTTLFICSVSLIFA